MSEQPGPHDTERIGRHPVRTGLIRVGCGLALLSGIYLAAGLSGLVPLELVEMKISNIRIVAGLVIVGCLMAAVGYGEE